MIVFGWFLAMFWYLGPSEVDPGLPAVDPWPLRVDLGLSLGWQEWTWGWQEWIWGCLKWTLGCQDWIRLLGLDPGLLGLEFEDLGDLAVPRRPSGIRVSTGWDPKTLETF